MDFTNIRFEISDRSEENEHIQHEIELIYVLKGKIRIWIDGNPTFFERDGIILINMGRKHAVEINEGNLAARLWIPAEIFRRHIRSGPILFYCSSQKEEGEKYQHLRELMYKICGMSAEGTEKDFYRWSLYCQLAGSLLEYFKADGVPGVETESESVRTYYILSYIYEHFREDISLDQMAKSLYLSTGYASRYFKKTFGMNFKEYVGQVRMEHAVEELKGTEKSITRIAMDNGFANSSVFHKKFSEKFGMSPTQYRKSMEKQEEENSATVRQFDSVFRELVEKAEKAAENEIKGRNRQIRVKPGGEEPLPRTWQQIINIGPASDILQAEQQNNIRMMQKNLKFRYGRLWNIFSDTMRIQEKADREKYNFRRLDVVLDFLLDMGMKPFIDLDSRPRRIYQTAFRTIETEYEPEMTRSREEYGNLLRQFLRHVIDRYTADAVQTWKFEIWNNGKQYRENRAFFEYFSNLYRIIKEEIPEIQVGGCGCAIDHYKEILTEWEKESCQPDFLTFSSFPYRTYLENGRSVIKYCTQDHFLLHSVKELKSFLKKGKFYGCQIYFTEWNSTVSNRSCSNDSCWKGAYIAKNMIEIIGEIDGIGYWILSDLYADSADCIGIINGASGLITRDGYAKPACYAFNFLSNLGKKLILRGNHYLISRTGKNRYEMVCHNYIKLDYQYYLNEEYEIRPEQLRSFYSSEGRLTLNFRFCEIEDGEYVLRMYRVNENSGSIQDEWIRLGCEENLSRDEIRYIKQKSSPSLYKKKYEVHGNDLEFDIQMEPQEIALIQIERISK